MKKALLGFVIAAIAVSLLISFISHFSTYFGVNAGKYFPGIWMLHVGAIISMGIAVLITKSYKDPFEDPFAFLERATMNSPNWMKNLGVIFFIYTFINFIAFFALSEGLSPAKENGKFYLHDHGKIVRYISEQEYEKKESYILRGFSGHWMFFYFFSLTVCLSKYKENNIEKDDEEISG